MKKNTMFIVYCAYKVQVWRKHGTHTLTDKTIAALLYPLRYALCMDNKMMLIITSIWKGVNSGTVWVCPAWTSFCFLSGGSQRAAEVLLGSASSLTRLGSSCEEKLDVMYPRLPRVPQMKWRYSMKHEKSCKWMHTWKIDVCPLPQDKSWNINRDHLYMDNYLLYQRLSPTKFEACLAKRSWVISSKMWSRCTWPVLKGQITPPPNPAPQGLALISDLWPLEPEINVVHPWVMVNTILKYHHFMSKGDGIIMQ